MRSRVHCAVCLVLPLLAVAIASAQEAPGTFEFSFSNPGARSMGLGGAFVALADDATAAFANPAGLVQLVRPEVSVEGRYWSFSTPYTAGGRASGTPTGYGIDTEPGIRTSTSEEATAELSFLSFVYPGERWSLALYRHQLAVFSLRTEINGLFGVGREPDDVARTDQRLAADFDIVSYGVAGAWQVSEALSLGFGLSSFDGSVRSTSAVYLVDEFPATFYEPNSFLPERRYLASVFEVDTTDWGFSAGVLWHFAEGWKLGGAFRQGPEFRYRLESVAGPAHPLPDGTVTGAVSDRSIAFPDVYGLGLSYRTPGGSVTVGLEWDRVEYSSILSSLASDLVDVTDATGNDGEELHLGLEYVMLESTPLLALRIGAWLDPDHRIRYVGDDPFARSIFPPGDDTVHVALGLGVAFERFQLDVGVDFSDLVDTASLSVIYSF